MQPLGITPYGTGTPIVDTVTPTLPFGSRYLNPGTRDFERDVGTLQFKQMPSTRQRALLAVLTTLNSSIVRGFGLGRPRKMGPSFEREMRDHVRRAFAHLTDSEKLIRLDDIIVERGDGGRARVTVAFTDLTTGEDGTVSTAL